PDSTTPSRTTPARNFAPASTPRSCPAWLPGSIQCSAQAPQAAARALLSSLRHPTGRFGLQGTPRAPLQPSGSVLQRRKSKRQGYDTGLVQPLIALTLRTRDRLSRNCYARDARAPVNAILLRSLQPVGSATSCSHNLKNLRPTPMNSLWQPALPLRRECNRERRETHEKK